MHISDRIHDVARNASLQICDVSSGDATQQNLIRYTGQNTEADYSRVTEQTNDSIGARRFLIASITKPIVAMAALKLAAEGEFSLVERLGAVFPDFNRTAFRRITLRHLLTHTSGFPDMLPGNTQLRADHAPLDAFVTTARDCELDFPTATDCRYSSVGFLLLGAMIEQAVSMPLRRFLHQEFFSPLMMNESWLGLPDQEFDVLSPTIQTSILPEWQPDAQDWGWNSRYWRTLGAPWGGMMSTADDLGRFAQMLLSDGASASGQQILPASVVCAAMRNQSRVVTSAGDFTGLKRDWGFGWRKQWSGHQASFGDFVSESSIGHWGATGTMMWVDPSVSQFAVILTTTPYETSQPTLQRISNIVATAEHTGNAIA